MPFMQPQADHFDAYHIETTHGTEVVPADITGYDPEPAVVEMFLEGDPILTEEGRLDYTFERGWYARFSAPGYLDRTDWIGPEPTEGAALDTLAETWDVCRSCFEPCWDSENPCE